MKARLIILSILSVTLSFAATAQDIENDDMYFNSRDREKLNASIRDEQVVASNRQTERDTRQDNEVTEESNPTDSYSARNVNPEYVSRAQSQTSQQDDENYYVNDYHYAQQSQFNNWNNNYNSWYNNPWYTPAYYGSSINCWNSPYYGSYYDSWGNPWNNPYYMSGWSTSFSYHWGSAWNYGWGMSFGSRGWYDPWNYYGPSFYNPYYGFGYRYPTRVIIVGNEDYRGPVYGKRGSRSSNISRDNSNGGRISRTDPDNTGGRVSTGTTGRVRTSTAPTRTQSQDNAQPDTQQEYYNRSWSSRTRTAPTSGSSDNSSGRTNSSSGSNSSRSSGNWSNRGSSNSGSSWSGSNSNSGSSYTPSNSSGSSGSYTPSRSSSSGSSGGSRSSRGGRGGN